MKKGVLFLAMCAVLMAFSGCDDDNGNGDGKGKTNDVTISFSQENIMLDLGSSDADLLKFATASDGSAVTVSGVNYEQPGEHEATFTASGKSVTKTVKIKADKIAGSYTIAIYSGDGSLQSTGDGWKLKVVPGAEYNQINVPSTIDSQDPKAIFTNLTNLIFTFDKGKATIPKYEGGFLFMSNPATATFYFTDIVWGKDDNGRYAIKSFKMECEATGFNDFQYTATLTKTRDLID